MCDQTTRYLARTAMLLRLMDPEDLGHLVDPVARQEIHRCLYGAVPLGHDGPGGVVVNEQAHYPVTAQA